MIERVRFFIASLWAPLIPIGILVMTCVAIMMFPAFGEFSKVPPHAAMVVLILVPVAYTALVVATYCVARALYALHVLSRIVLLIAYVVLSLLGALLFSWLSTTFDYAAGSTTRAFLIVLAAGAISLAVSALVWCWVASSIPGPSRRSERSRKRRVVRQAEFDQMQRRHDGPGRSGDEA